jgi:hypothetical protein
MGPLLNHRLFAKNGSVSEYSATGQPYDWLFQSLDILSGTIIIFIGFSLWRKIGPSLIGRALSAGLVVLGFANMIDATFILPCSQTLDSACNIPVNLSPHQFNVPPHAYSSVIIGVCYLVLPLLALIYSYRLQLNHLAAISLAAVASAIFSLLSVLIEYSKNGGPTTKTSGGGQEIQMLILGVWLVVGVYQLVSANSSKAHAVANSTAGVTTKKTTR